MGQILTGKVVSNKMQGTVVVEVFHFKKHPIYGKYINVSKKYKAQSDEKIGVGAKVSIAVSRPMSKDKKWKVIKVL